MESQKTYHTHKGISLQRFYHIFCLKSYSPHCDTRRPAFARVDVLINRQKTTRVFIPCEVNFVYYFVTVSSQDSDEKHMSNPANIKIEFAGEVFVFALPKQGSRFITHAKAFLGQRHTLFGQKEQKTLCL